MTRLLGIVGALILVSAGALGAWAAARPPIALLVAPAATDVHITRLHWNEWQISYRVPKAAPWSSAIGRQLEAAGWASDGPAGYGALARTYSHATQLGLGELWEWAYLTVDPLHADRATIRLRRFVHLSWLGAGLPNGAH
ncbi:hypothetical protein SE17_09220 [Kouleothrix aurantiaca]|jgi:hypothetical protein|uniref:Uncharacterized protein n=1 Tax=Kouleothrix aurantiaca TaxID=186479 RepID=A0A0P9D381_9CHLR|nr:hypothetical protein SE17_09220 [Kouleothrix aurantiaca]